jgi:diguanylate cyclase (GGDEF)-like protein/PAS domain S-box-containing protein
VNQTSSTAVGSADPWQERFAQSGVAQAVVSPDGLITAVNAATCAMFARQPHELVGQPLLPRLPADQRTEDAQLLHDVLSGAVRGAKFERRLPHHLGGHVDLLVSVVGVSIDGAVSEVAVCLQDITALKEAQLVAQRTEARWRSLSQNASDVALITDHHLVVGYVSPALTDLLGHSEGMILGTCLLDLAHDEDRARVDALLRRLVTGASGDGTLRFRIRDADGNWRHVEQTVVNLLDDPDVRGLVVNLRDRTAQHELEASLLRATLEDPLTGLPNRALLMDRVHQALEREHGTGQRTALLFVNVDRLKAINDAYGHRAGDEVLRGVADTLCACVGPTDTVGRYGGDEFVVLLEVGDPQDAEALAVRVAHELSRRLETSGRSDVHVSACVGVAQGPAATAEALISSAEAALLNAKQLGRGRVFVLEAGLRDRIDTSRELSAQLASALDEGQLVVHFQPLVDLTTGTVRSFEALVRWQHPRLGLLGPDSFLPQAEALDLQVHLDEWVLREACRTAREWTPESSVSVAINVAPAHLTAPGFTDNVRSALAESGLPAGRLILEITETAVVTDVDAAQRVLQELAALGVRISIDDFGTGYSSMLQLRELPFSELKIDREFVRGLPHSRDDAAICASVIDLARRLGVRVIAEGVENAEQAAALKAMGCDVGQGYLWSPAVAAPAAQELLDAPAWVPPRASSRWRQGQATAEDPKVVARARELHEAGASLHTIAAGLNREGARTATGLRWHPASVARLLVATEPT